MGAIHQIYEQEMFYNWIGDGKRCVAFHEAGHAAIDLCAPFNWSRNGGEL